MITYHSPDSDAVMILTEEDFENNLENLSIGFGISVLMIPESCMFHEAMRRIADLLFPVIQCRKKGQIIYYTQVRETTENGVSKKSCGIS